MTRRVGAALLITDEIAAALRARAALFSKTAYGAYLLRLIPTAADDRSP